MNRTLRIAAATAAVAGGALIAAGSATAAATTASGATFPKLPYAQWCNDSALCSYTGIGSGGGIKALTAGTVDWAGSDATLSSSELSGMGGRVLYYPTLLGAVTVPVNIPGTTGKTVNLAGKTIGDIFAGKVTTWNNGAITSANKKLRSVSSPITLCVRSDSSGTSFGFSNYLAKVSPNFRSTVGGASKTPNWPSNMTVIKSNGNPGVLSCVKQNPNSIGYVDMADVYKGGYYDNVVNVGKSEKVGKKRKMVYVRPTLKSTSAAGNLKRVKSTLDIDFSASSAKGAYPITITTWALCKPGMAKNGDVQKVLKYFYGSKAQGQLKNYLFAPLPAAVKKVALKRVALCK